MASPALYGNVSIVFTSHSFYIPTSSTLYYYYKNNFDDSEIELMISVLEAHNYLSAEDISGLVTKLAVLSHGLSDFKKRHM